MGDIQLTVSGEPVEHLKGISPSLSIPGAVGPDRYYFSDISLAMALMIPPIQITKVLMFAENISLFMVENQWTKMTISD